MTGVHMERGRFLIESKEMALKLDGKSWDLVMALLHIGMVRLEDSCIQLRCLIT